MRDNADKNNTEYGHFLRSGYGIVVRTLSSAQSILNYFSMNLKYVIYFEVAQQCETRC